MEQKEEAAPKGAPPQGRPETDARDPREVVSACIDRVLELSSTWTKWDGKPVETDDRIYTPMKALRRVADHLVDHLAELDARESGSAPIPDTWHGSFVTTPSDLAPVTDEDLNEARNRLERLRQMWQSRLSALSDEELDRVEGDQWSLREVAFHVAESAYYADAVGSL